MLKVLFLGVFVAVVALAVTAEKPKDKVVVLDVNGLSKKENSLKNLKLPKVDLKDVNKKGEVLSVLRELKREDFEKLTDKEKSRLLKKMKKEALKWKRHRMIQKLKRKFLQKRKFKRKQKKEKKAFLKNLLKQKNFKRLMKKKSKKAHKREHKKHHKRGKNQKKREKTPEKKKQ